MEPENDIIIVGGGLAGLTCAIHLLKSGFKVTLIEKSIYPHHKVCGEYISNEVLPYLNWLNIDFSELHPTAITRLSVSSNTGKAITCNLPLGGFGISRFTLDQFLYERAKRDGCIMITDTVNSISIRNDETGIDKIGWDKATNNITNSNTDKLFEINTSNNGLYKARIVIGAYGKRSGIDQKLLRSFIRQKSPWLAVKGHYNGDFPNDLIGLHNFKGGYCGMSKVEDDRLNICYLVDYENFKKHKNIEDFQQQVLYKNPHLKQVFENSIPLLDQPLTISQISFEKKEPVYDHILMIGDTAGLIHPLCGNGMAMAIHSAKICAELTGQYLSGIIKSRAVLEDQYRRTWNANFKSRLATGKLLSGIIRKEKLFEPLLNLLVKFPSVLPFIVKRTHGKPIN